MLDECGRGPGGQCHQKGCRRRAAIYDDGMWQCSDCSFLWNRPTEFDRANAAAKRPLNYGRVDADQPHGAVKTPETTEGGGDALKSLSEAVSGLQREIAILATESALNRASLERMGPVLARLGERWGNAAEKAPTEVRPAMSAMVGAMRSGPPRSAIEYGTAFGGTTRAPYDANGGEVPFDASEYERPEGKVKP